MKWSVIVFLMCLARLANGSALRCTSNANSEDSLHDTRIEDSEKDAHSIQSDPDKNPDDSIDLNLRYDDEEVRGLNKADNSSEGYFTSKEHSSSSGPYSTVGQSGSDILARDDDYFNSSGHSLNKTHSNSKDLSSSESHSSSESQSSIEEHSSSNGLFSNKKGFSNRGLSSSKGDFISKGDFHSKGGFSYEGYSSSKRQSSSKGLFSRKGLFSSKGDSSSIINSTSTGGFSNKGIFSIERESINKEIFGGQGDSSTKGLSSGAKYSGSSGGRFSDNEPSKLKDYLSTEVYSTGDQIPESLEQYDEDEKSSNYSHERVTGDAPSEDHQLIGINNLDRLSDVFYFKYEDNSLKPNDAHSVLKRSVCKPNQAFQSDCNSCKCAADGQSYSCTQNECMDGETNKEVEVFKEGEGVDHIERHSVCKPRNTFYVGCNTCHCNPYGTNYTCTNKPCPLPKDVEIFHELKEMKPIVPVLKSDTPHQNSTKEILSSKPKI